MRKANKNVLVGLFLVFLLGIVACNDTSHKATGHNRKYADVKVKEQYALDFPIGSCGGFGETGVRWTAPEDMTVDLEGGVWRVRSGRIGVILSMWIKGEEVLKNVLVYGSSTKPYTFSRMIANQGSVKSGEDGFLQIVSQQGEDDRKLRNISVKKGDEIYIKVEGGNFIGINLTIGKYDLAKDFSNQDNPNGPWAFGAVKVDANGKPDMILFDTYSGDFEKNGLPEDQKTWMSSSASGLGTMMKLVKEVKKTPEIRYDNGSNIYVESLVNGEWRGLYWSSDYHVNYTWEFWTELDSFSNDAFELTINNQLLSQNWQVTDHYEKEQGPKGKHYVVELKNEKIPVKVKIHTLLDGTSIFQRWLEVTNSSDKPMAVNSVYPWKVKMMARSDYEEEYAGDIKHAFKLGYFSKQDHMHEGWFKWDTIRNGVTEIGCGLGSCFDDPFFIIRNGIRGQYLIGELAWPTNWNMKIQCKENIIYMARPADVLSLKIGPQSDNPFCVLSPGESMNTPVVHMGYVSDDLDAAVQTMHEHVRRSVLPPRNKETAYLIQFTVPGDQGYLSSDFGDPSNFTEEAILKKVDMAAALGVELFTVDARWWDFQGDWFPSKTRFPHGIKPIADYVHKKGMLFGLYAEIERAGWGSKVLEKHPDWQGPGDALKINKPEVAEHVEKEWRRIIEEYDIDLFRLDFNAYGMNQGAHTQKGKYIENNYYRYYKNFFEIVDRIRRDYPDVILQECSIGGARNDYSIISKFDEAYLTDGLRIPRVLQVYSGQTLALPPEILVTLIGADGCYSVGTNENLDTYLRATFTLGTPFIFEGMTADSIEGMNPVLKEGFRKYGKLYKDFIRPILPSCKVYHHAPVNWKDDLSSNGWFAIEFTNEEGTKGWVTLVKIGGTGSDVYVFKPRGLDPSKTYKITIDSKGKQIVMAGYTMERDGIPVRLEGIGHSELLLFEEKGNE